MLAAAISPQLVKQIQVTCHEAGLRPLRLVLRPCAAASLVAQRGGPAAHRIRLLVDLLAEEADLTVLVERDIVLMRTVRLPAGHADEQYSRAASARFAARLPQPRTSWAEIASKQVVLCGHSEDHRQLAALIGEKLQLRVAHFDPFAGLSVSRELKPTRPKSPSASRRCWAWCWMRRPVAGTRLIFSIRARSPRRPAASGNTCWRCRRGAVAVVAAACRAWLISKLQSRARQLPATRATLDEGVNRGQLPAQGRRDRSWNRATSIGSTSWRRSRRLSVSRRRKTPAGEWNAARRGAPAGK